jgi:hypothetical protein
LSNAIAHVIPQNVTVAMALARRYTIDGMACSFSPMRG